MPGELPEEAAYRASQERALTQEESYLNRLKGLAPMQPYLYRWGMAGLQDPMSRLNSEFGLSRAFSNIETDRARLALQTALDRQRLQAAARGVAA